MDPKSRRRCTLADELEAIRRLKACASRTIQQITGDYA
jgi:hypothetical protein